MTLFDKLTTLPLGSVQMREVSLADALNFLRQQAHDADPELPSHPVAWGVPIAYLLPEPSARALRVNVSLENPPLLEALLATVESVGLRLHVNPSGCFAVPSVVHRWLDFVRRDAQGHALLPPDHAAWIPGLAQEGEGSAPQARGVPLDTIQAAFELPVPPFEFERAAVETVVEFLAVAAPDVPLVALNPRDEVWPAVSLAFAEWTTLGEVVAAIEERAGLEANYQRTGITLHRRTSE